MPGWDWSGSHGNKGGIPELFLCPGGPPLRLADPAQPAIHTVMAAAALVAAYAGKFSRGEVVLLLVTITLVVGAELLNTAIEVTVDLISPEYNHLARVAKNVAAAAVLVTACNAVLVGILLFGPPLLKIVQALSP